MYYSRISGVHIFTYSGPVLHLKKKYYSLIQENFEIRSGVLYYSATKKGNAEGKCDRLWKIAVRSEKEKDRILQSCHSDAHGDTSVSQE